MKNFRKQKSLFPILIISLVCLIGFTTQSCLNKSEKEKLEKTNLEKEISTLINRVETEAWTKGNVEILDEMYEPDCIVHLGSSIELRGTQSLKQMITMFHNLIPDRIFKIDELIISNNRVAEMYSWEGIHKSSGKKLKISGCIIYHFKDGKVIEVWNFEDMLGLYQQLGFATDSPFGQSNQ